MSHRALVAVAVLLLTCAAVLPACSDPETIQGAATCEGAVTRFLDHTGRMQEDLDPAKNPSPELIHDMTDEAEALRGKAIDVCGGDAEYMREMSRQRAPQGEREG